MLASATLFLVLAALPQPVADWPVFRGGAAQDGLSAEPTQPRPTPAKLEELWKYKTKQAIEGAPAIVAGVVYVGSYDDHLHAIDLKTGSGIWKSKIGPVKSSPGVAGNRVYAGDADGVVHCLDIKTGKEQWKFEAQGEITGGPNFAPGRILIGSHDESLYCLNEAGEKQWEFKASGPINGVPSIAGAFTFVAGCDNNLHIVEIATGKEKAKVDLGGQSGATAAIAGEMLYVGTMNNEVLAVDLKTEKVIWRFEAAKRQQPFYSSAAVTDSLVIVGSRDKRVYAIDRKTGKEVWNFLTDNRVDSSPVVWGGQIFVGSQDGILYVLNMKGVEEQNITLDGAIIGSPAVSDGRLVIGTEKGTVYCFGKK